MKENLFIPVRGFYQIAKEEAAAYGPSNVGIKELLAILIGSTADMNVCSELASLSPDRFAALTKGELRSVYGLPEIAAQRLIAAISLSRKTGMTMRKEKISSPSEGAKALSFIKNEEQEHMAVLILDTKNNVKQKVVVTKGTINSSLAHPREVFKQVVRESAAAIILGHNHPSGDPTPSREDIQVTNRLVETGKLVGIEVLDHIIVAGERYVSLREKGLI